MAQSELFEGIKFKCAICGMRFVRNQTLKKHLDIHFEHNAALKKIKRRTGGPQNVPQKEGRGAQAAAEADASAAAFGCTAGGIIQTNRLPFQSISEFTTPKKATTAQEGADNANSNFLARNVDEVVAYDGSRSHDENYNFCYLCKERLEVAQDEGDEGWYFLNVKQLKLSE